MRQFWYEKWRSAIRLRKRKTFRETFSLKPPPHICGGACVAFLAHRFDVRETFQVCELQHEHTIGLRICFQYERRKRNFKTVIWTTCCRHTADNNGLQVPSWADSSWGQATNCTKVLSAQKNGRGSLIWNLYGYKNVFAIAKKSQITGCKNGYWMCFKGDAVSSQKYFRRWCKMKSVTSEKVRRRERLQQRT